MAAFVLKTITTYLPIYPQGAHVTETMPVPVEMLTWPGGVEIVAIFYPLSLNSMPYLSYRLKIDHGDSISWLSRARWDFTQEQFAKIMALVKS